MRATVAAIIPWDHSTADVTMDLMARKMATTVQVGFITGDII
mgnify:FL=1